MMTTPAPSIKYRILIPLIIVLVILLIASMFSIFQLQNRRISDEVQAKLQAVEKVFEDLLASEARVISSTLDRIQNSSEIQEAWVKRDRAALLEISAPVFASMRNKFSITHLYYIKADHTCYLRVHNPTKFGDVIQRFTLYQAAEKQSEYFGIELGNYGTFTLRVVRPWIINGVLSGYLEMGMEIEHLTPELKDNLGSEVLFIISKQFLDRSQWEQGLSMLGIARHWDDLKDFVIIDQTLNVETSELEEMLMESNQRSQEKALTLNLNDEKFRGSFLPLRDAGGRIAGRILVLNNVTRQVKDLYSFAAFLIIISLVIGQLLLVFFSNYIGGIEIDLNSTHHSLSIEIDERKKTEVELKNYRDHLEELVQKQTLELTATNLELKEDIRKRQEAEKELQEQSRFVLSLYESLSHPFYVIDAKDYTIQIANSASGFNERDHISTCHALTHGSDLPCSGTDHPCPLEMVKRTGQPVNVEHLHVNAEGETRVHDIHGYPIFDEDGNVVQMIEYVLDVTDRRRIEEEKASLETQLNQSQKLETIGELVDSVAHEINTPTGIIAAHVDAMLLQMDGDDVRSGDLNLIRKQTRRISQYTRTLLNYSRRSRFQPAPENPANLVDECLYLLGHRFRARNIIIKTDYADNIPELMLDRLQIEQVFMNILNNAVDAINNKGEITINISIDIDDGAILPAGPESVIIEIGDNGDGIKEENLGSVFESFFTTKSSASGTGLGLSISKAIIQRHNGRIDVASTPGSGTVFKIVLPVEFKGEAA